MSDPDAAGVYVAEQQLRAVYDLAEQVQDWTYDFYGYRMTLPQERKFADLESVAWYYEKVCELSQVQILLPGVKAPAVRKRRGAKLAHYDRSTQTVAICVQRDKRWALRELVVLHELAHHLTPHTGHGDIFRKVYRYLVNECMGQETAMVLGAFFDQQLGSTGLQTN